MSIRRLTAKEKRKTRVRAVIFGRAACPRLSVHRTNKYIYAQLIDDEKRVTLAQARDKGNRAHEVGKLLAEAALKKKIKKVVFDRGSFLYHGRVKALAEGAREGGLIF